MNHFEGPPLWLLVKNLPAMWETWVQFLGWKDPLEKGKATHSSILAWRIPWTVHGVTKSWTQLSNFAFTFNHFEGPRWWLGGREPTCNAGDMCLIPGSGRYSGGGNGNSLPVFLPEKSHGLRNLAGYSLCGHKELDMTYWLSTHPHNHFEHWLLLFPWKVIQFNSLSCSNHLVINQRGKVFEPLKYIQVFFSSYRF